MANTYLVKIKNGQTTIQADGPQEAVTEVVKKYWKCDVDVTPVPKGNPNANAFTKLLNAKKESEQWYFIAQKAGRVDKVNPIIAITKSAGKEKLGVVLFEVGKEIALYQKTIPDFLKPYIQVQKVGTTYTFQKEVGYIIDVTLRAIEGVEKIHIKELDTTYPDVDSIKVDIADEQYAKPKRFVIAYEEIDAALAKEKGQPQAPNGKYYNVWWKKNADTTLTFKDGKCYEKPKPVQAQLCTKEYPTFLGNVQDKLKRVDKGWQYKVSWQPEPLFAEDNKGYWVKYGEGDFNYLNVNTESAAAYAVLDANGNPKMNLVTYHKQRYSSK